jgi:putative transcriptional regulator
LAKRGLSLLRAKRAIEAMIAQGAIRVRLPHVDFGLDVIKELTACGIKATRLAHAQDLAQMLKEMRENLELTQEQFALRYGFELDTLQNWEQGRTAPPYAHAYLRAIRRDPNGTALAQEDGEE